MQHAVFNESDLEGVRPERVPDVVSRTSKIHLCAAFLIVLICLLMMSQILVKKGYRVSKRASKRRWKLKHLDMEVADDVAEGKGEADRKA